MIKNETIKVVIIFAVLIFFLFGIFGIPQSFTPSGLLASLQQRIHLGLDLKGGTHLILQVQVNDAINADSDRAVERLRDDFKSKNVVYAECEAESAAESRCHQHQGRGAGVDQRVAQHGGRPAAGLRSRPRPGQSFTLIMKPSIVKDTKTKAQQQAIETIRNRIDPLGVSEPVIQEHGLGDYQILVQLPGVDDPARVKEIMQSTAMLEIRQALGGPYDSEAEAMAANGGVLPPDSVTRAGSGLGGRQEQRRKIPTT